MKFMLSVQWAESASRMLALPFREVESIALHAGSTEEWAVFECHGSANGPWQVQRNDIPGEGFFWHDDNEGFETDSQVWEILFARYELGDFEAHCVMAFLSLANPQEYNAILESEGITDGLVSV